MSFLALLATLDAGCPAPRREAASGVAAAYQSTSAGARGGWADILDPQLDRIGVAGCFGASSTTRPSMEVAITEDLRRCKRISRTATAS